MDMDSEGFQDQSGSDRRKKPFDIWLALIIFSAAIIMWLIPKTPLIIIIALIVIFVLLSHPVWNFWWIERELWRRCCALLVVAVCLTVLGYYVWPNRPLIRPISEAEKTEQHKKITSKEEARQPEQHGKVIPSPSQANKSTSTAKQDKERKGETKKEVMLPPAQEKVQPSITVALRFVYPKSPALMIINESDVVVRDIKWTVILWNMDLPERGDPLPIPVQTFDWLKGYDEGGPQNLFSSPLVAPLLKPGNRLFGSASVNCPTCTRGRTYIVYIVWGEDGWFSEVEAEKSGKALVPATVPFSRDSREKYFAALEAMVPEQARLPIIKEPFAQVRAPSPSESKSLSKVADLGLEFWGKDSLTFRFLNFGNESAQNPKYTFVIIDLTNQYSYPKEPDVTQPLPIPTQVISDFVRPKEGLGSFEVLNEATKQHVKAGDKLFGLVWVTCFNCAMTRPYWLYFEVGKGAWYSYNASGKDFPDCIRTRGLSSAEIDTCIDEFIPSNERTIIPEKNQRFFSTKPR